MKKITLIKSLFGFSLIGGAFLTTALTTNCGNPHGETVVVGNTQGTDWPGYISGTLTCALNENDKTCIISANNNYVANSTFTIPEKISVDGIYYTVVTIGERAFKDSGIVGINLNKVNAIGVSAFEDCFELKAVNFGTVSAIGNYAFQGCATLATINLRNVTSIGDSAFYGVPLSKINIDEDNSIFNLVGDETDGYIHKKADGTANVTAVCGTYGGIACGNISTSATHIGDYAFYGCSMIDFSSAYLANVGAYAFSDCFSLHTLYLGTVTSIGDNAFAHCPISRVGLNPVGGNYKWCGYNAYNGYLKKNDDTTTLNPTCGNQGGVACGNVSFTDGETTLASNAFYDAEGITSIVFNTVTTFQSEWNCGCMNLYSVTIGSGSYTSTDNGWNQVGLVTGCILYAPDSTVADAFKTNVILPAYAAKWTYQQAQ